MAMRNWWGTIDVEGRKEAITFGPRSSGGEFTLTLCQRDHGESRLALDVYGRVNSDGTLLLTVRGHELPGLPPQTLVVQTER